MQKALERVFCITFILLKGPCVINMHYNMCMLTTQESFFCTSFKLFAFPISKNKYSELDNYNWEEHHYHDYKNIENT